MVSFSQKIADSKQLIREIEAKADNLPLFANFSGGKDSQVMLHLMLDVTSNVETLFMKSSIDLPYSIQHVEREIKKYNTKHHWTDPVKDFEGDFLYWVRKFGYFPSISYNFCSSRLKLRPARAYLRKLYGKATLYKFNGVRRYESSRRQRMFLKYPEPIIKDWEHSGSYMVFPILEWTSQEVKKYLKMEGIDINPNYKLCMVSGCYYCPFYQPKIFTQINDVYPGIYESILALEREIKKPSVIGNRYLRNILNQLKLDNFI